MKSMCNKKIKVLIVISLVFLQVLLCVFVGVQKQEFHIDEIYSYMFSNTNNIIDNFDPSYNSADWMWEDWINGSVFDSFLTVQNGESFAYKSVYMNNTIDCHPPLFYWALHTVSSFFPNQFSKWFGLSINILFFAVTAIFIALISKEMISSAKLRYLPLILYGFSPFAIDTCTFIRMYMLLTMFSVIFVYIHVLMIKKGINKTLILLTMVTIYLGALTQYYFLILSFWGVLFFAIYLLKNKQIKQMFQYGIGACISVAAMLASYPYAIFQATGNGTNNVGQEVTKNLLNLGLWKQMTINLIKDTVNFISYHSKLSYSIFFVAIVVFLILAVINLIKRKNVDKKSFEMISWISGLFMCVFLSVTFIGGEYVYLRYIYFIIPLLYIAAIAIFDRLSNDYKWIQTTVAVICIVFAVLNVTWGTIENKSSYLFLDSAATDVVLDEYTDEKLIVIVSEYGMPIPASNMTKFEHFDNLYMDTKDNIIANNVFSNCVAQEEECIVFIATDPYWVNGFDPDEVFKQLSETGEKFQYYKIADGSLGNYYHVVK